MLTGHLTFGALAGVVLTVACLQLSDGSQRQIPQQKSPIADTAQDAPVLIARTE